MSASILVVQPGVIHESDIAMLRTKGVVVIKAKDPHLVQCFDAEHPVDFEAAAVATCREVLRFPRDKLFSSREFAEMLCLNILQGSPMAP